jgi:hypothetical protein
MILYVAYQHLLHFHVAVEVALVGGVVETGGAAEAATVDGVVERGKHLVVYGNGIIRLGRV